MDYNEQSFSRVFFYFKSDFVYDKRFIFIFESISYTFANLKKKSCIDSGVLFLFSLYLNL